MIADHGPNRSQELHLDFGNDMMGIDDEGMLSAIRGASPRQRKDAFQMKRLDARTVELTEQEQLVKELYDIQLDQGHGCAAALMRLAGHDLPPGLRTPTPILDSILTVDFVSWLIQ
jgi:hypothetical protein